MWYPQYTVCVPGDLHLAEIATVPMVVPEPGGAGSDLSVGLGRRWLVAGGDDALRLGHLEDLHEHGMD